MEIYRKPFPKNWPSCRCSLHWYIGWWNCIRFITDPRQAIQICDWSWWSNQRMGWRCCQGKEHLLSNSLTFSSCLNTFYFHFINSYQLVNVQDWFARQIMHMAHEDIQELFHQMPVWPSTLNSLILNKLPVERNLCSTTSGLWTISEKKQTKTNPILRYLTFFLLISSNLYQRKQSFIDLKHCIQKRIFKKNLIFFDKTFLVFPSH